MPDRKTTLVFIQPYMTAYRRPVFEELGREFDLTVICDRPESDFDDAAEPTGFRQYDVPLRKYFGGKIERLPGVIGYLIRHRPDNVVCFGSPRNLTFWACLFLTAAMRIPFFVHTQGPYKHNMPSRFQRSVYFVITTCAYRVIMYAPVATDAMRAILPARLHDKIVTAENSFPIDIVGNHCTLPDTQNILFIGRLREGCGLELLLSAFTHVRQRFPNAQLHIVGGGDQSSLLTADLPLGVVYHGIVYDQGQLEDIAAQCVVGVYPGDAGLSVIHYLAMGLPVVVHDEITKHMGPEPSFIEFGKTGLSFERNNATSLAATLCGLLANKTQREQMSPAARDAYGRLAHPSLAQRIAAIVRTGNPAEAG